MIKQKRKNEMRRRHYFAAGLAAMLAASCMMLGGCSGQTEQTASSGSSAEAEKTAAAESVDDAISDTGTYFDTVITITLYSSEEQEYLDGCFDIAQHYENLLSNTVEDSDIAKINDADGEYVTVDDDTLELIETALEYCKMSDGKFDITVGVPADLWHITTNDGELPDADELAEAVKHVDYNNISIKDNQVALTDPDAKLDLGAIAKGFIADKMKAYLEENGVGSAIINLGGNVLVVGSKPDGSDYKVGVEKPFDTSNVLGVVTTSDKSVVTSGIYQRYFELDGTIYHHILDTTTGEPVQNGLYSVTIISDTSVQGDALSTMAFVYGLDDGMDLIESIDGVEAVFVTDDMQLHCTSGIGSSVNFTEK